jgi:hypothetical protein
MSSTVLLINDYGDPRRSIRIDRGRLRFGLITVYKLISCFLVKCLAYESTGKIFIKVVTVILDDLEPFIGQLTTVEIRRFYEVIEA